MEIRGSFRPGSLPEARGSSLPIYPLDPGDLRCVELAYPLAAESLEFPQAPLALADEPGDVYPQSLGFELSEALRAVAQEARGLTPVTVLKVVEADTDLQDTLVEERSE